MTIKGTIDSITASPIGALVGGAALYLGAKKFMKVENKYALVGLALVGVIAGAMAQSKMKSKASVKPAIIAAK